MSEALNIEAARKAAQVVRETVAKLQESCSTLKAERERLQARNEVLLALPVNREDAKAFILSTIDMQAQEFIGLVDWGANFSAFAYPQGGGRKLAGKGAGAKATNGVPALCLMDIEQCEGGGQLELNRLLGNDFGSFFYGGRDLADMAPSRVCFFFGDLIKQRIEQHFDELFPTFAATSEEAASSIAERRAEIEKNGKRVRAINAELDEFEERLRQLR